MPPSRISKFRTFLLEEDGRIDPSTYDIQALYDGLNARLFNRELPDIPVSIGRPPKGASGVTTYMVTRPGNAPKSARVTKPGTIVMVIAAKPFRLEKLYGIVAHEMVHVWCAHTNHHTADSHGVWFQAKRAEVEPKLGYKIPMRDEVEDEERGEEKPAAFIAGKTRDGKEGLALFKPNALDSAYTQAIAAALCKAAVEVSGFQYAIYGTCMTSLVENIPIQRQVQEKLSKMKFYMTRIDLLHHKQVMGSFGKV